jgi:hypothetical protein
MGGRIGPTEGSAVQYGKRRGQLGPIEDEATNDYAKITGGDIIKTYLQPEKVMCRILNG